MINNGFGITTESTLHTKEGQSNFFIGSLDAVRVLFEYLFSSNQTMKEKNKYVILFLQHHINKNNTKILIKLLSDQALRDCHPSILKSILIMTENVQGLEEYRLKTVQIFQEKMEVQ